MIITEQTAIPVISINPLAKQIKFGEMESLDKKSFFQSFLKIADLEVGVSLYALPFMDMQSGNMVNKKCFICTDNDIVETEGIGLIPFADKDKAMMYMEKLKKMIEWQY
ncbi:hypothetical protein [Sulfurimonas sp.]